METLNINFFHNVITRKYIGYNLVLIISFILSFSLNIYSQSTYLWEVVPCPVTQNLNCISPYDNNHIVGNNGTVLKFDGTNWISLSGAAQT